MKRLFTTLLVVASVGAFAQQDNVGIGTVEPDNSAILDLSSSEKGFLMPRMSETQRTSIKTPAQGLQVYQTDGEIGNYTFDGIKWVNSTSGISAAVDPWLGGGNAASAGDFLGTTNSQPLVFKTNNTQSGYADFDYSKRNTFFGFQAGIAVTGIRNLALGYQSMRGFNGAISGNDNVGIGTSTLAKVTSGSGNLGIATFSLQNTTTGNYNVGIGTNALNDIVDGSNNVAIGRLAGFNVLGSNNVLIGNQAGQVETGSNKLYITNSNTTKPLIYGDFSASFVSIGDVEVAKRSAASTGGYNLLVKGGILTEKVKVALASSSDWADYVFEDSYSLMPLSEVETFTKANKHLPNVPSADEMVNNGLEIGETSKMFMEKIEELTLYMIEMNKEIKALKLENELIRKQN
ncbi:MAG: hypothetical protein ACJA2N_001710 [Salibacteraceae bacterium]|jgi:hypothetical protein